MYYEDGDDPYFDDEELDDEDEGVEGSLDVFIRQHDDEPKSILTVRISATAGEDVGYALRLREEFIELVKHQESGPEAITVLGTVAPGSDALRIAFDAAPDLLTFPPTAAVNITTNAPDTVADGIRFTSSPESNRLEDLFGDDGDEVERLGSVDDLTPLRVRINRRLHFAAKLEDQWVIIPMTMDGSCPVPLLDREFISISYFFDSGWGIGSGSGLEMIGEIRPGLNVYWDNFDGETYNLGVLRSDLVDFASGHVHWSKFEGNVVDNLIGGLDDISETDLEDDPEDYDEVTVSCNFNLHGEEGVRFLHGLLDRQTDESYIGKCIEKFLNASGSDRVPPA